MKASTRFIVGRRLFGYNQPYARIGQNAENLLIIWSNQGKTYLSLRLGKEEPVGEDRTDPVFVRSRSRGEDGRYLMRALVRALVCSIFSILVVISGLTALVGHSQANTAAMAAIDLSGASSGVVVETRDCASFQAVMKLVQSNRIAVTYSSEETNILTISNQGLGKKLVDRIAQIPGVVSVSSERKVHALFTPDDTDRNLQWGLAAINAYQAWDITRGNHSVVVAVLDTGIDWNHPDLAANIWSDANGYHGFNFISNNRQPMDDNVNSYDESGIWQAGTYTYHGTHVAGVVGAVIDNNLGVAGMAQVQLMAVKVMNESGEGTDAYVASGIKWAVDNHANIITMSLGVDGLSMTLSNMVNYASSHGVVMVAASGNSGSSVVSYPAAYPKVIAVGAIDSSEHWAPFSNYGENLDVVAPGVSIYSTQASGGYQYLSGTSTAAPYVAGVAALMLTVNPALTPVQIGQTINDTAKDIRTAGWDDVTGWGILDAFRAVEQVSGPAVTITSHPSSVAINGTFSITWMVSGGNPGAIQSTYLRWGSSPTSLTQNSSSFTGQTWASFTVNDIPSLPQNGTIYLKAYATVDGGTYESGLLELPVQEAAANDLFTQFLRNVRNFIVDDLGWFNFLLILFAIIAIPAIVVAARSKRHRAAPQLQPQYLHQYQPIAPAQYLPPPPPPPPRFETYVDLMGGDVMPSTVTVFEGTKVVWVNRTWAPPPGVMIRSGNLDQAGEHPDGTFQSGMLIAPGDYWSATFHRAGEYPYYITGVWKAGKVVVEKVKSRPDNPQGAS
jgi:subtilisin family serine protease